MNEKAFSNKVEQLVMAEFDYQKRGINKKVQDTVQEKIDGKSKGKARPSQSAGA